jgi:ribA/ribD-fused uncharacterized protein
MTVVYWGEKKLKKAVQQYMTDKGNGKMRFEAIYEDLILNFLYESGCAVHPRAIERAHRLGPKIYGKTRPIIVRFNHPKDRAMIWNQLGHGTFPPKYNRIHVREDFPPEIDNARAQLLPIAITASKVCDPTTNKSPTIHLVMDKLYINSENYTVNSLNKLPDHLKPHTIFTPSSGNKTAYFTKSSPLSNHYPSPFTVNGDVFNCMEQYCITEKARLFQDQASVVSVMSETDPVKQKQAGKSIKGFNQKEWESVAEEKLILGLTEKFRQNTECRKMLLSTSNNIIIEANPHDKFLGSGLSLYSKELWSESKYPGRNIMGKLLQRVRNALRHS